MTKKKTVIEHFEPWYPGPYPRHAIERHFEDNPPLKNSPTGKYKALPRAKKSRGKNR